MIVVTGSAGFVGRHVVSAIFDAGIEGAILEIDRASGPAHDLNDAPLDTLLRGATAIIHCAAHADVRRNWDELGTIQRDNVDATMRLLQAAATIPTLRNFVFVSTGAVYAGALGMQTEDDSCRATSPYAASKLTGEAYVQAYAERFGWRWCVTRPAACFGAGYHHGHVADFVRQAKETGRIHALDIGAHRKPAVHVEDLARVLVAAATSDRGPSGVLNVVGGLWGWRDTARMMGIRPTCEERKTTGWIGDSATATFDSKRLCTWYADIAPSRAVHHGVADALTTLGWSRPMVGGSKP